MNSTTLETTDMPDNPEGQVSNSFSYSMGLSLGVLLFIIVLTYASYICTRLRHPPVAAAATSSTTTTTEYESVTEHGLSEAVILQYPTLLYSQYKLHNGGGAPSGCSICLADYKDTDLLRLLPECGHLFHRRCIDPWLRLNPTCPICRNTPAATPLSTPAAEVVPFRTLQNC